MSLEYPADAMFETAWLTTTIFEMPESYREGINSNDSFGILNKLGQIAFVTESNYTTQMQALILTPGRLRSAAEIEGWTIKFYNAFETQEHAQSFLSKQSEMASANTALRGFELVPLSITVREIDIVEWFMIWVNCIEGTFVQTFD